LKKSTRIIDYDSKALLEEDFRKSHLQEVLTGLEITKFNGWTKSQSQVMWLKTLENMSRKLTKSKTDPSYAF